VISREAVVVISSPDLDDAAKEKATQLAAVSMLKLNVVLIIKISIILCAAVAPILVADLLGYVTIEQVSSFSLRLDVLLITTVVVLTSIYVGKKALRK